MLKSSPDQVLGVHEKLLAGSTAGVIAQTTIYPLEVIIHVHVHVSSNAQLIKCRNDGAKDSLP